MDGVAEEDVFAIDVPALPESAIAENKVLHLGILDQVMIRMHVPVIFCFPMPDQRHTAVEKATKVLRDAAQMAVRRWPFLAGKLYDVEGGHRKNMLEVGYVDPPHDVVRSGVFQAKVIRSVGPYEELSQMGMPSSALDCETLTSRPLSGVNRSLPVLNVQANFIRGGLFLAFSFTHSVMDGISMSQLFNHFASCTRNLPFQQGTPPNQPLPHHTHSLPRSQLPPDAEIHPRIMPPSSLPLHPFLSHSLTKPPPPSSTAAGPPTARIFTIPTAHLTRLKSIITAHIATTDQPHHWVSTHDTLCALLWTAILRARAPRLHPTTTPSVFCCTVNTSPKHPTFPPTYFGNAVAWATATVPLSTLLTTTTPSLTTTALAIRASLTAIDAPAIDATMRAFATMADPTNVIPAIAARIDKEHTGVFLTSWASLGAREERWGAFGQAEWVRKPWWAGEGVVCVLPRWEGGDWEVLVGLGEGDMEGLEREMEGVAGRVVR